MKRILALTLTLVMLVCALASCGGRDKVDISAATNLDGLAGATLAAQTGTFHLDALNTLKDSVTVREYEDFAKLLVALKSGEATIKVKYDSGDTETYNIIVNKGSGSNDSNLPIGTDIMAAIA